MIASSADDDNVTFVVRNSGRTVAPRDIRRVYDRFWRGDTARQASAGHCGLGLSLCRTLVEHLGGSTAAAISPDGRFTITIHLPGGTTEARP